MPKKTGFTSEAPLYNQKPADDQYSRDQQMINLAYDTAERQMKEGTASPLVIAHFLKLGTEKAKLEAALLEKQSQLADAKVQAIEDARHRDDIVSNAVAAFKAYSAGIAPIVEDVDDY